MTDERYTYVQTQKERKQIANGARGRKGSRGPKSCKMPSDYMTRKEKLALNGEVKTWSMKSFYSYDVFKTMPTDIQIQYINYLTGKYDVSFSCICREVLGCSVKTFNSHVRNCGIKQYLNEPGRRNKKREERLHNDVLASLTEGIAEYLETAEEVKPIEQTPEKPNQALTGAVDKLRSLFTLSPEDPKPCMSRLSFEMDGFDREFMDILEQRFAAWNVRVSVTVEVMD